MSFIFSRRGRRAIGSGSPSENNLFIGSAFESNSGGAPANTDAAAWELIARNPKLKFWNVNTQVFEQYDPGTNNNLDHWLLGSTTHGWELQLANLIERREFLD
jgi:hypothetical protein